MGSERRPLLSINNRECSPVPQSQQSSCHESYDGVWQCLAKPRHPFLVPSPAHWRRVTEPHWGLSRPLCCRQGRAGARVLHGGTEPTATRQSVWLHPPTLLWKQAWSSGCSFLHDLCPRGDSAEGWQAAPTQGGQMASRDGSDAQLFTQGLTQRHGPQPKARLVSSKKRLRLTRGCSH